MRAGISRGARSGDDDLRDLTDEDLLERARHDPEAFGTLYQRHASDIEAFIRSRVDGDHALAQDLTSQVFIKALAALPHTRVSSARGWLYQIARNAVVDVWRRHRPATPLDAAEELASQDRPLDDHVASEEARRGLHDALDRLTRVQRDAVALRLHGLTNREIGQRLGMSEQSVKSAQHRAFATLRETLGERP